MQLVENDGGRAAAGFKGMGRGDCVTRAIAIATGIPYREVYDELNRLAKAHERRGKRKKGISSSAGGVFRSTYERFLKARGWKWTPTMRIGSGCKVHMKASELPKGVLILSLSRHLSTVIDGVVYDTHDPSRNETRCVYGYYSRD